MRASIEAIQEQLRKQNLDGWFLYVWRDVNPVACTLLELPAGGQRTRRAYYWIPANGSPRKLQHAIEPHTLAHLPGEADRYLSYTSLQEGIANLLKGAKRVAMEYSPNCLIPTVSWVDAGTVEYVRSCGVQVASSAELIQFFEATLNDDQIATHFDASAKCRDIAHEGFAEVGRRIRAGKTVREFEIQSYLMDLFAKNDLITDHPPIVAANANASDPHYCPTAEKDEEIKAGDVLLIDLWARGNAPENCIYADQTWMGFIGAEADIPARVKEVWELARDARRAGFELVKSRLEAGETVYGWEVDDAVRKPIEDAGLGDYFIHRTGHSMSTVDHASGANIDNLETKELRPLIPRTLFSIEPGIYLPKFGVRTENNVLITEDNRAVLADDTDQENLICVSI